MFILNSRGVARKNISKGGESLHKDMTQIGLLWPMTPLNYNSSWKWKVAQETQHQSNIKQANIIRKWDTEIYAI